MATTDEDRINLLSGMVREAAKAKKGRQKTFNAALGEESPDEDTTGADVKAAAKRDMNTPAMGSMSQADFSYGSKKAEDKESKAKGLANALRKRNSYASPP